MELEDVLKAIAEGENERVEFKEDFAKDIGKEICALANAEGGYILIGVDDKGVIKGYRTSRLKDKISSYLISITPLPKVKFFDFTIKNKKILVVKVEKSKETCTIGNTAWIRIGTSKRALTLQEIISRGVERVLLTIDKSPTLVEEKEIDREALRFFSERRVERGLRPATKTTLKKLGTIVKRNGKDVLTFAGVLCFVKTPQHYYPFTSVRIKIGEDWYRVEGTVFELVEKTMDILFERLARRKLVVKAKRIEGLPYPSKAVREALVNALVHRNYAIESEVFVYAEENKIRISNPGSFPEGTSPEDPKPLPRNPLLYELMFQAGYVEREGQGIKMMREECEAAGIKMNYMLKPNWTELIFEIPEELGKRGSLIINLLKETSMSATELASYLKVSRVAVLKELKVLLEKGIVGKKGKGRSTKYFLKRKI